MEMQHITVDEIKELVSHFAVSGLGSFTLQDGGFSLRLESDAAACSHTSAPVMAGCESAASFQEPAAAQAPAISDAPAGAPCALKGTMVTAPVVGTFYRAPSPEKPPFIKEGQTVKKGDVLFIIESMKLMNEVESECDGVVGEILVKDGQGVEYGQPLITLL